MKGKFLTSDHSMAKTNKNNVQKAKILNKNRKNNELQSQNRFTILDLESNWPARIHKSFEIPAFLQKNIYLK